MTSISITRDFPVPSRPASRTAELHTHVVKSFSLVRLWAMARKEAIQLRRDARSLGLAFVLPLIMLILFGYAITTDVQNITTAVVDRDHTPESRALTSAFSGSNYFKVKYTPATSEGVEELIDLAKVRVVIVIPERFSVDLKGGRPAPVELLLDGSDAKTANVARGYADAIARTYSQNARVVAKTGPPPVQAQGRVWYNETLDSRAMIVPGLIAVIMSIISAMLTSLTISREWERGTMEQLAATPVSRAEVILGKLVPYLAIGLIDVAVAVLVGVFVFDIPFRGNLLTFALGTTVFLIGVLGLGTLLSTTLKSQLLATQAAIFATYLPALLFSGFMYTVSNMPVALQWISAVVPARYYVTFTRGVFLKGNGLAVLWPAIVGLAIYAGFMVAMSIRNFRKELT
ncbi:MAG TPA: ABC transporter permease [Gemmatimonadaceae bacterium]|nr:ABC transporter permease [Gemmatimonadaceae bacterium]